MFAVRFTGKPVEIRYLNSLRDTAGNPAHAQTFIRKRLVVLDSGLTRNKSEHRRILLHEIFHFVWVRLGNRRRLEWEELLRREWASKARGETGWSAEWRRHALHKTDVLRRTRLWREYCCESFCDTAAFVVGGAGAETTLGARHLSKRSKWFYKEFATGWIAI